MPRKKVVKETKAIKPKKTTKPKIKSGKVTILAFQRKNITYYVSVDVKAKDIEKLILKFKKII